MSTRDFDPYDPVDGLRVPVGTQDTGEAKTSDSVPCPTCGRKPPGPRAERKADTPKLRSRVRIDIPVDEREHGFEDFHKDLDDCAELLTAELGYTVETPDWYVLRAVVSDWRDRRAA